MGTKNAPGDFDCYANADIDEPMFILLGRDRHAPALVLEWADKRELAGEDPKKVANARACAAQMLAWRVRHVEQQQSQRQSMALAISVPCPTCHAGTHKQCDIGVAALEGAFRDVRYHAERMKLAIDKL